MSELSSFERAVERIYVSGARSFELWTPPILKKNASRFVQTSDKPNAETWKIFIIRTRITLIVANKMGFIRYDPYIL